MFVLLTIPAGVHAASGPVYYVAENGDDANAGTVDAPWLTIRYAAETLQEGDTLYIRSGVYHESVHVANSGGPGSPIVISAYPGEKPVIDGIGVSDTQNGMIIDTSYLTFSGLELRNWEENAIWGENAGWIEISDCEIHDVGYGIGFGYGSHDLTLNRVEIHHFDFYGFDASPSGGDDCYNIVLNDCMSHTGRDPEQNVDGYAIGHGDQHNVVLNRCMAYRVFDGFDIGAGSHEITLNSCAAFDCINGGYKLWGNNILLKNCLAYDNEVSNIELDWDGTPGTTTLWNCDVIGAGTFNIWVENSADSLHMYNCILAGGEESGLTFEEHDVSNYQGDYNIFHNTNAERAVNVGYEDEFTMEQVEAGDWAAYSGQDVNSFVVDSPDQIFVDVGSNDFRLKEDSPAIDSGTDSGAPADDFNGFTRQGTVDIGAYEYGSSASALPTTVIGKTPRSTGLTDVQTETTESPQSLIMIIAAIGAAGLLAVRERRQ